MITAKRSAIALAMATLLSGGCASGYETARNESSPETGQATIEVSNHNWSDMNIYLVSDGIRERLGTVMSQGRQVFKVPSYVMATASRVHLMADPIGSMQTYTSPPLLMRRGQQVQWQLENSIQLSSLMVR